MARLAPSVSVLYLRADLKMSVLTLLPSVLSDARRLRRGHTQRPHTGNRRAGRREVKRHRHGSVNEAGSGHVAPALEQALAREVPHAMVDARDEERGSNLVAYAAVKYTAWLLALVALLFFMARFVIPLFR